MPRKVISVADAARLTTIAEATWYSWAKRGRTDVPRSFKLAGRRVLFEDEVLAWVEDRSAGGPVERQHTGGAA